MSDWFLAELARSLQPSDDRDASSLLPPLAWAACYRRIDDQPFSLARFTPLKAIYEDDHPHIVVIKPAQVGVSEMAVTRAAHALDVGARYWHTGKNGLNVAYLFPTKTALGDFSKERISALKRESRHLAELFTGEFDDITFKQVGDSYLYLRGAWSEEALLSFPADFLILDEYDRMDKAAIALARKRLRASLVKRELDISTPTLPGVGIHAEYLASDQRVWEIPCAACDAWVELDFFRDVRANGEPWDVWQDWDAERLHQATMDVVCPHCGQPLDRFADGRWVARAPAVTRIRGYQVPALCFPSVSLNELAVHAVDPDPTARTEFFRSDLGLPYEAAGSRVTIAMLQALSAELPGGKLPDGPWRQTTMGVDVGARFHYRISATGPDGQRYVRAMGAVRSWDELDMLMSQYRVRRCVIDAMPEIHGCKAWADTHAGKVLRAWYPSGLKGDLFAPEPDKLDGEININRTMAMDAVYTVIATGAEHWPAAIHNDGEVQAQLTAPVRVVVEDASGQEKATWEHTSPDHFYHSCVYDVCAYRSLPKAKRGTGLHQGRAKGWGVE